MLGELLNSKVRIMYTSYTCGNVTEGIVVGVDDNFVKLDTGLIIAIKYIVTVKPL